MSRTIKLYLLNRQFILTKQKHPKFPPTLQVLSFKVTSSRKPLLGQDAQRHPSAHPDHLLPTCTSVLHTGLDW